jgi:hypothetical protein
MRIHSRQADSTAKLLRETRQRASTSSNSSRHVQDRALQGSQSVTHKSAMLWHAMTRYHETLKAVLENTLAIPDLMEQVFELDKKEKLRPGKFRIRASLY